MWKEVSFDVVSSDWLGTGNWGKTQKQKQKEQLCNEGLHTVSFSI